MSEEDAQTVDFGSTAQATPGDTSRNSGGAAHRAGYMEAPAQVEGAAREDADGAVRPMVGPVLEG
jgi:hypothetical protein